MEAKPAARGEGLGGGFQGVAAHRVEGGVEALGGQFPQPFDEALAVLHGLRAQAAQVFVVAGARGADDPAAGVPGDLDGERSDAPGRRVDQDRVALADLQGAVQHLVRGQPGQRQTRRLLEAQAQGLAGEGAHGGGDVLGERTA